MKHFLVLTETGRGESACVFHEEPPKIVDGRLTSGRSVVFGLQELTEKMVIQPLSALCQYAQAFRDKKPFRVKAGAL